MPVDHFDLTNAIREAKQHTNDKAKDLEFYVDDKVRDLRDEDRNIERIINGLKDRISMLEERVTVLEQGGNSYE